MDTGYCVIKLIIEQQRQSGWSYGVDADSTAETLVSHRNFIGMREILIYSENMLPLLLCTVKTSANDTNFSNLEAKNA